MEKVGGLIALALRLQGIIFIAVFITMVLLTDVSLANKPSPPPCEFPAVFNFGDSNSDTGGWSAAFGQAGPPAGQTFFRTPSGRYSDGRLIIDFIAESLGLPYLNAYLDSMGTNFSHGANFATAASTIRPQNISGFSPFSFNVQFNQFFDFMRRSRILRSRGGFYESTLPKEEYFSEALYTFDIAQNDLTAGYFSNLSLDQVKASLPDILNVLTTYIKSIYGLGGRNFWIHNTAPLGCLPYLLDRLTLNDSQVDQAGCSIELNKVAQYYNFGLKEALAHLREDMPLAALTYVDIYSLKYQLISQPTLFGFERPLEACCGHGGKYNFDMHIGCGAKTMVNGTQVVIAGSCPDPTVRISWDGAHFTEAANKWVFDRIVDGSHSDPPVPLKWACYEQTQ